eukprot:13284345-Alexandrium_andersonii.AAC.1
MQSMVAQTSSIASTVAAIQTASAEQVELFRKTLVDQEQRRKLERGRIQLDMRQLQQQVQAL